MLKVSCEFANHKLELYLVVLIEDKPIRLQ